MSLLPPLRMQSEIVVILASVPLSAADGYGGLRGILTSPDTSNKSAKNDVRRPTESQQ